MECEEVENGSVTGCEEMRDRAVAGRRPGEGLFL